MTQVIGKLMPRVETRNYRHIPESSLKYDKYVEMAQKNPGKSVLVAKDFPVSKTKALRNRRRRPWYTEDGNVVVMLINSKIDPSDNERKGDLMFQWQEYKK